MTDLDVLPYNCVHCSSNFKDFQDAKNHFLTAHGGKKLFKCTICEIEITRADGLKTHFATVHEEKKTFKCKVCEKISLKRVS